jgi:hypothetical protein
MMAIWVHGTRPPGPANDQEFVAWGADEDQLREFINPQVDAWKADHPDGTATFHEPVICYWLLDAKNFGRILNGPNNLFPEKGPQFALAMWNHTRLYTIIPSPPGIVSDWFFDQTQVEAEGSPRKTWSHGH